MSKLIPLFVYGTLRAGHQNSARFGLDGTAEVYKNQRLPGFNLFELGWFPGIKPGDGTVVGDIFFVKPEQFEALDAYEGTPHLYHRATVDLDGLPGVQVYIYNGNPPGTSIIKSGDWFNKEQRVG